MPHAPPRHRPTAYKSHDECRPNAAQRGYCSARWKKLRRMVLRRDPVCRICNSAIATEVHHVKAKADGGKDAMDNLQGLCKPCHSAETYRERTHAARGGEKS